MELSIFLLFVYFVQEIQDNEMIIYHLSKSQIAPDLNQNGFQLGEFVGDYSDCILRYNELGGVGELSDYAISYQSGSTSISYKFYPIWNLDLGVDFDDSSAEQVQFFQCLRYYLNDGVVVYLE